MKLIGKAGLWIAKFFIYGVVWGLLYENAGYMKTEQNVK